MRTQLASHTPVRGRDAAVLRAARLAARLDLLAHFPARALFMSPVCPPFLKSSWIFFFSSGSIFSTILGMTKAMNAAGRHTCVRKRCKHVKGGGTQARDLAGRSWAYPSSPS